MWRGALLRGGTLWDLKESGDPDPHRRTLMERFIGLDAHASSCTLGVVSPGWEAGGLARGLELPRFGGQVLA
jgi:hypothetical protein